MGNTKKVQVHYNGRVSPGRKQVLNNAIKHSPFKGSYPDDWNYTYELMEEGKGYAPPGDGWLIIFTYYLIHHESKNSSKSSKSSSSSSSKSSKSSSSKSSKGSSKSSSKSSSKGSSKGSNKGSSASNKAKQDKKKADTAKKDKNFMLWLKYSYFNDSQASDADWQAGKTGEEIPDSKINEWKAEYDKALKNTQGKNKTAKVNSLLASAKEKGGNSGREQCKAQVTDEKKKEDIEKDEEGTWDNNGGFKNTEKELKRVPQYYVMGADGNVKRVLTDKELERLKKAEIDPSTGQPVFTLGGSNVIVVQQSNGDFVLLVKDEIDDINANLANIDNQIAQLNKTESEAWEGDEYISETELIEENITAFDPRLGRFDSLVLGGDNTTDSGELPVLVPFASDTVASCFSDMVFTLSKDDLEKWGKATEAQRRKMNELAKSEDQIKKMSEKITNATEKQVNKDPHGYYSETPVSPEKQGLTVIQKSGAYDPNYKTYKNDPDLHGTHSLMNPYAITRLYGSLGDIKVKNTQNNDGTIIHPSSNRMYDIRDTRRFYDVNVNDQTDFLSVSQATTTNIIKCSNQDKWGRTPYTFTDFVFCKYWNIIPNNRLITLRKYSAPCLDNLNFEGMGAKKASGHGWNDEPDTRQNNMFSPVATAVTYFGEGTNNTLSEILTMSTGLPWGETEAQIWDVEGDQGSNEQQVVDDTIQNGISGFGFLDNIAKSALSFGKFVGLFEKGGFDADKDQGVVDKRFENMVDPYTDGPYNNRILGPVNKISKLKQRAKTDKGTAEDLKFEHKLEICFQYIARPIGGINTKAAILDILANLLEMGSASAVFWGGAHKFKIKPSTYPWGGAPGQKGIMHKLYQGKIFGEEGALHDLMKGLVSMGTDENGNFSWDTVTNQLKNAFQGITGAVSQAINAITDMIFPLKGLINKAVEVVSDWIAGDDETKDENGKTQREKNLEAQNKGKEKMNNLMQNTEQMLKAQMIKNTTMPTIRGLRALLIGNPVGEWHLTIGNPLNPIAVIGNLVCSNMQFKFSDDLGPDDFPMELECTFTLEHGMARDKDAISSMFNRGAGKIYNLPDSLRTTSDYETKVDAYTGTKTWRMGMSFTSQASLLASTGYCGTGMRSAPTSPVVNSKSATLFLPKFQPVIVPDSGSWQEVKQLSSFKNEELVWNRGVYKANLATRKFLIG